MESSPKILKKIHIVSGLIRGVFDLISQAILGLLGISNDKSKGFLVVSFNQVTIEIIYVRSFSEGIQVLDYDVHEVLPGSSEDEKIAEYFIAEFLAKNSITSQNVVLNITDEDTISIHSLTFQIELNSKLLYNCLIVSRL